MTGERDVEAPGTPPERPFVRARGRARRELLLQASAELFRDKGFHAVSIDEVGAAAGISGPAIYRHFDNKVAILVALFELMTERLLEGSRRIQAEGASPSDGLAALIDFHIQFAASEAALIAIYAEEEYNLPDDQRAPLRRNMRLYFEEWVHLAGEVRRGTSEPEVRARVHAAVGIINASVYLAGAMPEERLAALLRTMAMATLAPDAGHDTAASTAVA